MCGIAGFQGEGSLQVCNEMINRIAYRGPDYLNSVNVSSTSLAHARLSILDLSADGNQPMFDATNDFVIVFNGEIYNYKELKSEILKSSDIVFNSSTDTEVVLNLYKLHGAKMLNMLNGMFSMAIYNKYSGELFIARDRLGQKPLHYAQVNNTFVFGSEVKSVLAHPEVKKSLSFDALNSYLTFDYIPSNKSIIEGVQKLEPGHFLLVKDGNIVDKQSYWQPNFEEANISYEDAKSELFSKLEKATTSRLMSDVPLGVFLSGGLDSSIIASLAQKNSKERIKTFSIGFEDSSYDESEFATKVAQELGTDHHSEILSSQKSLELIPEIYSKLDEPFSDASLIPTYFLSKITSEKVTVALGGDGSDELLAGYPTFTADRYAIPFKAMPNAIINGMISGANFIMPSSDKNISFDFKVKQFLRGFTGSNSEIHQLWLGSFTPAEKKKLLLPEILNECTDKRGLDFINHCVKYGPQKDKMSQQIHMYLKTYLVDDILFKVDRASMYNSLEVRSPFLDVNVVDFINKLPSKYKRKGSNGKRILKDISRSYIPNSIIDRPKKGFGIPLSDWLRNDLKEMCLDLLSNESLRTQGIFNVEFVQKLINEHLSKKRNHRKLLWNLIVFQLWYRNNLISK